MSELDNIKVTEPDSGQYITLSLDPEAKEKIKAIFLELLDDPIHADKCNFIGSGGTKSCNCGIGNIKRHLRSVRKEVYKL